MIEQRDNSKSDTEHQRELDFKSLLTYLAEHSPFYQRLFAEHSVSISGIHSINDIHHLPVTTKQHLQQFNMDFLCVPRNRVSEYCTTSGTLGTPVTIALTEQDLERLAYNEYLSFTSAGCDHNDMFQLMLSLDRQFMAGIAYYSGIRRLGGGIARVGAGNLQMQLEVIQRLEPTVLIAVPSFIAALIKSANEKGIDLNALKVKKIICIGENIRGEDLLPNALARQITSGWNVQLYSTYASTEMQTAFTECGEGRGGHHHAGLLVFEILDEKNNPLPAGAYGELTITTLGVEGMPLLRYKTGDICAYFEDTCACGRTSVRLSPVSGRKHQLIKYSGTSLYPQNIFNVLNGIVEVRDYVVLVSRGDLETDELVVHIAVSEFSRQLDSRIRQALQSALRIVPKIEYMSVAEVQQMQIVDGQRKPAKLIDKRPGL